MKLKYILIIVGVIICSCNDFKNAGDHNRPSFSQTTAYLSQELSNGKKVRGATYSERSISFQVNDDIVSYRSEFIDPEDNTHWELVQEFSLYDISDLYEDRMSGIKGLVLYLENGTNLRLKRSLNGEPIHPDIPIYEELDRVYVTVDGSQFEGVKKAFENLIVLRRNELRSDYFEN